MDLLRTILKRAGLGFLAGVTVGNVITALTAGSGIVSAALLERAGSMSAAFLLQTLFNGIIGAASFAGTGFYDIEGWPLALAAVVHYAVIEAVYIPVGCFLDWFGSARDALIWVGLCAAAYLIIFLILWLIYRRQVRELNELNEERKQRSKQEEIGGTK